MKHFPLAFAALRGRLNPLRALMLVALLLVSLGALRPAAAAPNWTNRAPSAPPSARNSHAMAYDSARGVTVLFGGQDGGGNILNDTWEWNGTNWIKQNPANSPDARAFHAMAYDSARGVTVLFGGYGNNGFLNDTWEWNGTNWTQRNPANSPSGRNAHAMAYDSARGVTTLFGGQSSNGNLNDTWEWNGAAWTQRNPANSPSGRNAHAMAYDSARGVTTLFGGFNGNGNLNDTWEWNGANWTKQSPASTPPARYSHAMAYDSARGVTTLFGGFNGNGNLNDTWEWNGANWTKQSPANSPPARFYHSLAYDSARGVTVLFGGYDGGRLNDTWEYAESPPAVASVVRASSNPTRARSVVFDVRFSPAVTGVDASDFTVTGTGTLSGASVLGVSGGGTTYRVTVSGYTGTGTLRLDVRDDDSIVNSAGVPLGGAGAGNGAYNSGEVYTIQAPTTTVAGNFNWTDRAPTAPPSARYAQAMAYDSKRGVTVLFGGLGGNGTNLNDTWEWNGANWTQQTTDPASTPSARYLHAMAYDSKRGVTVLFGGYNGTFLNDTWEWNGTSWTKQTTAPASTPSARYGHAMAYDSARGVTTLFGGFGGNVNYLNDTWEWNGTNWTKQTTAPASTPSTRYLHAMAYDSARGVTTLFAGLGGNGNLLNDTWEWNGANWTKQTTATPPSARYLHAMAYDSARGVTTLFGGQDNNGNNLNDTWEWNGATWTKQNPANSPPARFYHSLAYDSARGVTVLFGGSGNSALLNDTWEYGEVPNTAPVASATTLTGTQGSAFTGQLIASDADNNPLTYSIVTGTLPGGLSLNAATGVISGTPTAPGVFNLSFKVNDGNVDSNVAILAISIVEKPSLIVNTTLDNSTNTDGLTSLREAIGVANSDGVASPITFREADFAAPRKTIVLNGTQLSLANDGKLSITAPLAGVEISGDKKSRVFDGALNADVTLTGLTIRDGNPQGGGLNFNYNSATGIASVSGDFGGGIFNRGTLLLDGCTLFDNVSRGGGAIVSQNDLNSQALTLRNCTLSGNSQTNFPGGALLNVDGLTVIENSTIVGNTSSNGGNIAVATVSSANSPTRTEVRNSIIAGNSGDDVGFFNPYATPANKYQSNGYNLIGDGNAAVTFVQPGDQVIGNASPGVAALADNGGRVPTRALTVGSPAINAGDPMFDGTNQFDARGAGFPRVRGGRLDIGAFEVQNDAPTAIALSPNSVAENNAAGATVGTLSTTDPDAGDSFTYALAGGADDASFTIVGDKLNAKAAFDFETKNSYAIRVKSTDAAGLSVTKDLTVAVTNVNEAPVAKDDAYTVPFLVSTTINAPGVLLNDSDVDANTTLSVFDADANTAGIQPVAGPMHGTLTLRADGSFTYKPNLGYNGPDSFTYQATDGALASNTATVALTAGANTPPVAVADAATTDEDVAVDVAAVTNDTDAESANADLRVAAGSIAEVKGGTAVLQADGRTIRFTPAPDANGTNTPGGFGFSYKVTDGTNESLAAAVTITVNAVNDAPVASGQSVSAYSGSPVSVTLKATDVDGDALTYSVVQPANGKVTIAGNVATYTSNFGYVGSDSFTFKANDTKADSNTATVNINVVAGPAPPESGLVVTTLADIQANDGVTSLREAVDAANRDGKDSPITFAVSGTITLTGGELTLVNDGKVSITGPAAGVTIVGDGKSRVFNIASGADATLSGLNITGGNAGNANGGGILNNGALTLNGSTLFNNAANSGGAIANGGALTLVNSTLASNSAQNNGGGIFNSDAATATVLNSTIVGNAATSGGGIFKGKTLNLSNSIVVGNTGDNLSGVADAGGSNITSGTNVAAGLDPFGLRDNGGAVKTIALTTRGTAVNAGDKAAAASLTTDARGAGFPRIVSGKVDIGAFESAFGNRAPSLNNATFSTSINVPFSHQLEGNDADGDSLTYSRAGGTLPDGITLSSTGLLSGTPTKVGRYDFQVNIFDGTDVTVARFIIIVSSNADGIGPIITRPALNASYTRDEFANIIYRGTVRDVAPSGVTPSGVSQVTFQLRRDSDGFAYSGNEMDGFTSNVNLGYFPAFLSEPTSNTAEARDYRRTFGANGFVPSASVLTPGGYSLVIVAKDNAGNFSVEVVPVTITAATSPVSSASATPNASPSSPSAAMRAPSTSAMRAPSTNDGGSGGNS